jgi:hypothetical protein
MERIAPEYSQDYLQKGRLKPFCDSHLESLFNSTLTGYNGWVPDHTDNVHNIFKDKMISWLTASTLNQIRGLETFNRVDIINGCTQFIDNLYMSGYVQTIEGDYKYHERLGYSFTRSIPGTLIPGIPLIISLPFPGTADIHTGMNGILDECAKKNIPVHVDGAWITCSRTIDFNFDHPAIVSLGISLSKGLGLGWNRIGLRWTKEEKADSISIMNDFHMCNRMTTIVALYILNNIEPDYFWKKYADVNEKVCRDFDLTQTKAIHVAIDRSGELVGISSLMRYLLNV